MDLMTVPGIELGSDPVSGIDQPVCSLVDTGTELSDRILIPGDVVDGEIGRNFLRPLLTGDVFHHL